MSLKSVASRALSVPETGPPDWLQYFKGHTRHVLIGLACSILLMVTTLGWFQYRQINRVTLASLQGKDNLVWDFYKLEVQLMNLQMALREVVEQPEKHQLLAEVFKEYSIFASQAKSIETVNSGQVMSKHASFMAAVAQSNAYLEKADVYLENEPKYLDRSVAQALLDDSQTLRTSLHRVVLDAYQVENLRATTSLVEIRRFTLLYGFSSMFLIVLTLGAAAVALRRMVLNQRLQFERAEMLREKKETAEAANRAKAQFLSSASHDLRQPAHALGLFMDRLSQLSIDPQSKGVVASANAAVREMQNMLDGMFDLSRLDSESTQTHIEVFPLAEVFNALRSGLENDAIAKGLRFRIRPSTVWLQSDPALLLRILLNLVSNSIRYTNHGTVLVACRPTHSGADVRIEVWDSGIGIAPEDHEKVFQEFYQVANPQRDRRSGLGVGLSIVERCCRLLAHPLSLQSSLGAGTRVTLSVPLSNARPAATTNDAPLLRVPGDFVKRHVMVIEDDAMGRVALTGLLESWGCSVTAVDGAKMATDLLQKDQSPDLIISDLRLGGGINGIDAVRMLREIAGRNIAACLISGDTDAEVRQQVEDSGLVLLSKPVRPAKLRSLFRQLNLVDSRESDRQA